MSKATMNPGCGRGKYPRPSLEDRYYERHVPEPNSGCWLWTGTVNRQGYGVLPLHRRNISAHRFAYELHHGEKPCGVVRHKCDTPGCVNPDHLELGTLQDNVADMVTRSRQARGVRVATSKLTPELVRIIRFAWSCGGLTPLQIARVAGVQPWTIRQLLRGDTWKHVESWPSPDEATMRNAQRRLLLDWLDGGGW